MKIVQVLPGSGDRFYCENCVRDNSLVRALLKAGHEVIVAPMYLPQLVDKLEGVPEAPLFYGGINAYLQTKSAFFRNTPRWLDAMLDSDLLLRRAAKKAGSVRASGLGELTLSVMKGADGSQTKELRRLVRWLETMGKFDVVHLSSSLLLGIGAEIKRRFGVPVVCSLQDEDVWIDAMEPPYPERCWETMAALGRDVEAFVSPSRVFADLMRDRMKIDPARLHVVPVGVDAADAAAPPDPPVLGYLARMSRGLGLGTLVDAFLSLKEERFPSLRLHLSGGSTEDDEAFLDEVVDRFAHERVLGDVQFFNEFDPATRKRFIGSLSILSVPSPKATAYGTYILEANAAGVPAVQPRVGSFPELLEATGGGVLYEPNDAATLARELGGLLADPARAAELGRRGRESVVKKFSWDMMATTMVEVYRGAVSGRRP